MRRALFAAVLGFALALPIAVRSQVPALFGSSGNPVWTGVITTTNPTGNSPVLPLAGHTTCSVVASDTTAGTNVTVFGSAQVVPNIGSQWFPNPGFGTSGVISVGTSPSTTTGNIANYPGGFYFSWTGNTGTLTAYATCSTAVQTSSGGGGGGNVTIVGPLDGGGNVKVSGPVTIAGPNPLPVTTPAPIPTVSPGAAPAVGVCTGGVGCLPAVGNTGFTQPVTTTLTQLIPAPGAGSVRITAVSAYGVESATGGQIELEYGTGVNCATGTTVLALLTTLGAVATALVPTYAWGTGYGAIMIVPPLNAVCVFVTAGTISNAQIVGTYTVF